MQVAELAPRIKELGASILAAIRSVASEGEMRSTSGLTDSGDASFKVDLLAERVVKDWLDTSPVPLAAYTEEMGFIPGRGNPQYVLVVDALDGSRAFRAGLETACVSIAVARFRGKEETRFRDILLGYLWEIKTDTVFEASAGQGVSITREGESLAPLSAVAPGLSEMAWAFEVCGRPARELFWVIGDLVNMSAVRGGCFLFNSTTFGISRIALGRLDAYVDVGVRIVEELPDSVDEMFRAGQRQVLGLFPYDIAATFLIAKEAGIVMTDAYGQALEPRRLLGSGPDTRLSCIAARSSLLHKQIMHYIDGKFDELSRRPRA
ncbi:MAG TPA: inositol monophosphatase family protein [bacterium]|nr:inositol monophosphatase family protein [bacterium]